MQTCPYCRTVFDKLTTVEMYDALKSEGTEELSGIRIPLAIKGHRRSNNGNPSADEPLSSSSNLTEIDNRSQLHEPSKSNLVEKWIGRIFKVKGNLGSEQLSLPIPFRRKYKDKYWWVWSLSTSAGNTLAPDLVICLHQLEVNIILRVETIMPTSIHSWRTLAEVCLDPVYDHIVRTHITDPTRANGRYDTCCLSQVASCIVDYGTWIGWRSTSPIVSHITSLLASIKAESLGSNIIVCVAKLSLLWSQAKVEVHDSTLDIVNFVVNCGQLFTSTSCLDKSLFPFDLKFNDLSFARFIVCLTRCQFLVSLVTRCLGCCELGLSICDILVSLGQLCSQVNASVCRFRIIVVSLCAVNVPLSEGKVCFGCSQSIFEVINWGLRSSHLWPCVFFLLNGLLKICFEFFHLGRGSS